MRKLSNVRSYRTLLQVVGESPDFQRSRALGSYLISVRSVIRASPSPCCEFCCESHATSHPDRPPEIQHRCPKHRVNTTLCRIPVGSCPEWGSGCGFRRSEPPSPSEGATPFRAKRPTQSEGKGPPIGAKRRWRRGYAVAVSGGGVLQVEHRVETGHLVRPHRRQVQVIRHGINQVAVEPAAILFLRGQQRLDNGGTPAVHRESRHPGIDRHYHENLDADKVDAILDGLE